ncbi:MAG: DUF2911 domain-containing protein [Acidobacteria bacterium]|jgi:hypothetical protein|nr:DUF2911 domain-containing protein [Acidobacteriota bacterium]
MKKTMLVLVVLLFVGPLTTGLWAQEIKFPAVSPKASVTQTIGLTDVTINYYRPGVKGRVIWGDLVPYDKVWRTGANNATTIEFSTDVMIEGNKLAAGKYALFTIPGKDEWVFIFSKQVDIWGDYGYKEGEDVLRIKVKPEEAPYCEWMMFAFGNLSEDSAKVMLHWEKLMVGFNISVDTKGLLLNSIDKYMENCAMSAHRSANYAFRKEMLDSAKKWIDISVSIKPVFWSMLLKAKIYKKIAKTKKEDTEAIKILESAIPLGKDLPADQQSYVEDAKKLLQEWKGKK